LSAGRWVWWDVEWAYIGNAVDGDVDLRVHELLVVGEKVVVEISVVGEVVLDMYVSCRSTTTGKMWNILRSCSFAGWWHA
jgi:hypothetical protein